MTKELFDAIFDDEILPFIDEIQENNPRIKKKDIDQCKKEIYREYSALKDNFKTTIFGKSTSEYLLDRHKVAACMCYAFLKVSVFYKDELIKQIKSTRQPVEKYFYYVNEMIAFYAGCRFLSFFISSKYIKERKREKAENVIKEFPKLPPVQTSTMACYDNVIYNLSQVKTERIGLEHFDVFSYAMFFFLLESYFYTQVA